MKVLDIMTKNIISLKPDDTLVDVSKLLRQHKISSLPVLEDNKAIGIITTTDMANINTQSGDKHIDPWTLVKEIMTSPVVTIDENNSIKKASNLMRSKGFHHLVVLNSSGELSGVLSSLDLMRAID